jgi:hypothetical protein
VLTYVPHQLFTNCLCIHPAERGTLGTSLDLITSLINHSCDPNALVVFEGSSLRLRSIRKLRAGEEITQCYTDVDMDVLIRQKALKSDFHFDCHCEQTDSFISNTSDFEQVTSARRSCYHIERSSRIDSTKFKRLNSSSYNSSKDSTTSPTAISRTTMSTISRTRYKK